MPEKPTKYLHAPPDFIPKLSCASCNGVGSSFSPLSLTAASLTHHAHAYTHTYRTRATMHTRAHTSLTHAASEGLPGN